MIKKLVILGTILLSANLWAGKSDKEEVEDSQSRKVIEWNEEVIEPNCDLLKEYGLKVYTSLDEEVGELNIDLLETLESDNHTLNWLSHKFWTNWSYWTKQEYLINDSTLLAILNVVAGGKFEVSTSDAGPLTSGWHMADVWRLDTNTTIIGNIKKKYKGLKSIDILYPTWLGGVEFRQTPLGVSSDMSWLLDKNNLALKFVKFN